MYRFPITIDKTKVQGTNTNFVYLFNELCSSIPAGFWSHVVDTTTGLDIRFFDTDGLTELKREIVLYNSGMSKVEAWVQILSLGTAANKVIYCQYGGATRANDTDTWISSFKHVSHQQGNGNDSTVNGTNLSDGSSPVYDIGKIETGVSLNGASRYSYRDYDADFDLPNAFTLEAWINWDKTGTSSYPHIISKRYDTSDGNYNFIFCIDRASNKLFLIVNDLSTNSLLSSSTIGTGWNHVAAVYDGSSLLIYINGALNNSTPSTGTITRVGSGKFGVGAGWPQSWSEFFDGIIDEVRVSSSGLLADWIKTEYNNQNDPATFSLCSAEEDVTRIYKFPITIDKTKVQGTNTNFVYLFSELCLSIPAGFWAHVKDSGGLDISFFDTDGVTELKREIVLYSTGTNKVEAWVQIPSLGTASNKIIYCQYGGATKSNDTVIWSDIGSVVTYHYQGNANDTSGASHDGTVNNATQIDGKIQKAYDFENGNASITVPTFDLTNQFIYSLWMKSTDSAHDLKSLIRKGDVLGDTQASLLYDYSGFGTGKLAFFCTGTNTLTIISSSDVNNDVWHYVVAKRDGNVFTLYLDGVVVGTPQTVATSTGYNSQPCAIGKYPGASLYNYGQIDEVRILSGVNVTNIGDDWIKTEYNNQNDPATFSSCGSESSIVGEEIFTVWIPGII